MKEKPNILVCSDFSPFSDQALKAAEVVRQKTNGHLQVLHVTQHQAICDWLPTDSYFELMDTKFEKELLDFAKKRLGEQMKSCHVSGEGQVTAGIPASSIMQFIVDNKVDFVIMGHKGTSGSKFHMGSLTEKIVASSHVPVLVVKTQLSINKIGAMIDPQSPMNEILKEAEDLAVLFSSHLTIVSLFQDIAGRYKHFPDVLSLPDDKKEEMVRATKSEIKKHLTRKTDAHLVVDISTERKLAYHLNSIILEEHIDLPVMKRHQSDYLEKLLIGSETRRMLELSEKNLLILPP